MIHTILNNVYNKRIACPFCGEFGKRVELFTVRSLVKEDFIPAIPEDDHFFCADPDCEVVYYTPARDVITKDQIRTRIGLKEKEAPRPVCYCFGHTIEGIHDEIRETGRSTAGKVISGKIQAGLCHCEDASPEGRCCLGNVATVVREAFRLCTEDEQIDAVGLRHVCCKSAITMSLNSTKVIREGE